MTDRRRVETAALIRCVTATNQPPVPPIPAIVVDISDRELGVRLEAGADVAPNRMVQLDLGGQWFRGRIIWSREGIRNTVIAAVEFTDPRATTALRTAVDQPLALAS